MTAVISEPGFGSDVSILLGTELFTVRQASPQPRFSKRPQLIWTPKTVPTDEVLQSLVTAAHGWDRVLVVVASTPTISVACARFGLVNVASSTLGERVWFSQVDTDDRQPPSSPRTFPPPA